MENSQGKNFPRLFFQLKILNAKISHGFFQWKNPQGKIHKAKFCSADFCPRGARVSSRREPRKPHITSALCALVTACGACLTQFLFSALLFHSPPPPPSRSTWIWVFVKSQTISALHVCKNQV